MSGWSSDVCSSDLHHAAVAVHDRLGALVLEAAHGGALPRRRGRIEHVDLDHPAETVGLVRLGVHIEALVVLRPGVPALADGVALVVALLGMRSEERLVGKECVSTCRFWWSQYHSKKTKKTN